jgi:hypothetical protein
LRGSVSSSGRWIDRYSRRFPGTPPTSCRLASRKKRAYNRRCRTRLRTRRRLHIHRSAPVVLQLLHRRSTRGMLHLHLHHRRHRHMFCRLPTGRGRYRTSPCSTMTTRSRIGLQAVHAPFSFYIFFLSLCKLCLMLKQCKLKKNCVMPLGSPRCKHSGSPRPKQTHDQFQLFRPMQTNAR